MAIDPHSDICHNFFFIRANRHDDSNKNQLGFGNLEYCSRLGDISETTKEYPTLPNTTIIVQAFNAICLSRRPGEVTEMRSEIMISDQFCLFV